MSVSRAAEELENRDKDAVVAKEYEFTFCCIVLMDKNLARAERIAGARNIIASCTAIYDTHLDTFSVQKWRCCIARVPTLSLLSSHYVQVRH